VKGLDQVIEDDHSPVLSLSLAEATSVDNPHLLEDG
jgi:hypothetical protein